MDYKKYSLENLENWLHDVLSCGEASPHEIYSVIRKVAKDEYDYHKKKSQQCFGLLELMSGHRPVDFEVDTTLDDVLKEREYYEPTQAPLKWTLPVEQVHNDYFVSFPDDLLKAAKLKEGDEVNWIDNGDGSYTIRKVNKFVRGECYDDFENPCDVVESQVDKHLGWQKDAVKEFSKVFDHVDSEVKKSIETDGYDWTPLAN